MTTGLILAALLISYDPTPTVFSLRRGIPREAAIAPKNTDERAVTTSVRTGLRSPVRALQGRSKTSPDTSRTPRGPLLGSDMSRLPQSMGELIEKYARMADQELLMMIPDRPGTIRPDDPRCGLRLPQKQPGFHARLLYDRGILSRTPSRRPGAQDNTVERCEEAEVRVSARVPGWLVILDRRIALVPADQQNPRGGTMLIRNPVVVSNMRSVFGSMWQSAVPLSATATTVLQSRHREILRLMSGGLTDSAGARTLNISLRTYRRHVADIMSKLGVESRFQAGAAAHRLGWLG
ncbi:LuxR C-terminal-related transcriptional regulator [Streptomyces sp. NBC_01142]|uniref:helix-turn-helix transcriptional regulator n=1 Tax=Streptomyces sp. NBC_01142 TaxID=2975865 RepID=UPI002259D541|nr:LuxR C-terminal-related transcriptional regulator [Streptomyces sp. NBC_01142]MCX4824568.1 LuxR C-terminal-related transcriptional regulator [Streptomyces sp. NBC_01142]